MFIEVKNEKKETVLLNLSRLSIITPFIDPREEEEFFKTGIAVYYGTYDMPRLEDLAQIESDVFYGVTYEGILRMLNVAGKLCAV